MLIKREALSTFYYLQETARQGLYLVVIFCVYCQSWQTDLPWRVVSSVESGSFDTRPFLRQNRSRFQCHDSLFSNIKCWIIDSLLFIIHYSSLLFFFKEKSDPIMISLETNVMI